VFHPKLWVARYARSGGHPVYRVLCGSRNLTFDRCWDTIAVLDGQPTARGGLCQETYPLADFVAAMPAIAVGSVSASRLTAITELAADLRRVRFSVPDGFTSFRFWPMGIEGHISDPLQSERRRRLLVISPFLGAGRLSEIAGEHADGVLISRDDEIARIPSSSFGGFSSFYVLNQPEPVEVTDDDTALTGLHAKLYVADDGWDAHIWTGSANATSGAARKKVEFLLQLGGSRSVLGIENLLRDEPGTLREMLQEVEPREIADEQNPREGLERELEEIVHRFAERRIVAEVTPSDAVEFDVTLRVAEPIEFPDDVNITCWPLPRFEDRDRVAVAAGEMTLAHFAKQRLTDVSAFFVFCFELSRDRETVTTRIIIRADLVAAPENRAEAILRELLKDPAQVLRLIRALLQHDGGGVASAFVPKSDGGGLTAWGAGGETPLLEALLRALEEAPGQLDAVREILRDLADDDDLLPPGLKEICMPVLAIYEESRR
jgi:hypothetical protein